MTLYKNTVLDASDVRDYFKRTAASFDDLYGADQQAKSPFDRLFRKAMYWRFELTLDALCDGKGKNYLDVGCGSGRHATLLAERGAHVTGVDFSDEMLTLAKDYANSCKVGNQVDFQFGQFMEWASNKTGKFNAAYALGVFDYVDKPVEMLTEMSRLAEQVIVSWPTPSFPRSHLRKWRYEKAGCPVYFYKQDQVEEIHKKSGLEIKRLHTLGGAGFWTLAEKSQLEAK